MSWTDALEKIPGLMAAVDAYMDIYWEYESGKNVRLTPTHLDVAKLAIADAILESVALPTYGEKRCVYCRRTGRQAALFRDHIYPRSLGGSDDPENLQWLCGECNSRKGAKVL